MTTVYVLDIDGTRGKAAIYTVDSATPTDDAPLVTPRSYFSRLRFHSDFDYPRVAGDQQVSVSIPALGNNAERQQTYQLFAHGKTAGIPLVLGAILSTRSDYTGWFPLAASTPAFDGGSFVGLDSSLHAITLPGEPFSHQMLSLGANATHVLLHENAQGLYTSGSTGAGSITAKTMTIRVIVTDEYL